MKRECHNEFCSCVETVITVIFAVFRDNYISPLSCRMQPFFSPEQPKKNFLWGVLSIVSHLVLGRVRERQSESAVPTGSKVLGVQLHNCPGWSGGGIPVFPLAVCLRCYSPWCWFCCLGQRCELGQGKDPRQKHSRGEKRDFFVVFFSGGVCLLRIMLIQPRVVNLVVVVEATYTVLSTSKYSATVPLGRRSFLSPRARSSANRPCLQQSPARCNDLLWTRFSWLSWALNSHLFVEGWDPQMMGLLRYAAQLFLPRRVG